MIAVGDVFHGKFIEHSVCSNLVPRVLSYPSLRSERRVEERTWERGCMCSCCLGSHKQKTIMCHKSTEIPGPTLNRMQVCF